MASELPGAAPVMEVSRREMTLAQAAEWLRDNEPSGGRNLADPDGSVIGFMVRGPGWRLIDFGGGGPCTLWTGGLPR